MELLDFLGLEEEYFNRLFVVFFFLDVCLLFTERSLFTTTVPYAVRIVSRRDTAFLAGLYKNCKINFTFNF